MWHVSPMATALYGRIKYLSSIFFFLSTAFFAFVSNTMSSKERWTEISHLANHLPTHRGFLSTQNSKLQYIGAASPPRTPDISSHLSYNNLSKTRAVPRSTYNTRLYRFEIEKSWSQSRTFPENDSRYAHYTDARYEKHQPEQFTRRKTRCHVDYHLGSRPPRPPHTGSQNGVARFLINESKTKKL